MSKHEFTGFSIIVISKVVTRVMDKFIARCLYIPCTKTYKQFSGKVGISRPLIRDSVKECLDIASQLWTKESDICGKRFAVSTRIRKN